MNHSIGQVDVEAFADQASFALARDPSCARHARKLVRSHLDGRLSELALERVLLTASELVTNAWRHGRGGIELRLAQLHDRLRLEVIDGGSDAQPAVREQADESGGWGLRIVEQLALGWGVEGATRVWVELALD